MNTLSRRVAAASLLSLAGVAQADVVTDWNEVYLQVTRYQGGAPCPISRGGPMLNLAMYDAVNSIIRVENFAASHKPYLDGLPIPPAGASREAAAAAAAYTIMSSIYPMQSDENPQIGVLIQSTYDNQLALIPASPAKANGIAFGEAVAHQLLLHRFNDGYDGDPTYTAGGHAGDWRITPDGPFVQPFTPHWGNVMPWGLEDGHMFRPTRLTDFGGMHNLMISADYAEQINGSVNVPGVKDLGERNSTTRTADQTEAAWFWANDRDGTSKPPGQLLQLTKRVSEDMGLTLEQNAHLYGLVGLALGDACIAAWDAKYNTPIDLWRPIDAVRETLDDGNPLTTPAPAWLPLNDFTPPFPAYVSGHATFGAVHAAVMANYFGTDNITFTIGSDEFSVHPSLGYPANLTRTFTSFSQAAWENAMSRVWLGVHFYWDALDGNILGYNVGNFIFNHQLRPSQLGPCQSDMTADTFVDDADFVRFADQYNALDCRLSAMPWGCAADLNGDNYVDDTDFVIFASAYEALLCP
ncbi:MAG: vanadium-dependent haloperoxidase [Phycisphaerales bacterium]|nr:vanadium-dependent haloperoxidase [Phycisphaerales bacterium]